MHVFFSEFHVLLVMFALVLMLSGKTEDKNKGKA